MSCRVCAWTKSHPTCWPTDESDLVYHLSCSRRFGGGTTPPLLPPLQARWLTIAGAQAADGAVPQHYRHVFGQMQMFNHDLARHADGVVAGAQSLFDADAPAPAPPIAAGIARQFQAADWLALHFRRRVRMSLAVTHTLAALMGLAFILYSDIEARQVYAGAFLLLFGFGLMLSLYGQRRAMATQIPRLPRPGRRPARAVVLAPGRRGDSAEQYPRL